MKLHPKVKGGLEKKFQKVQKTPASFDFFVAVHDFVEYIEANKALVDNLSSRLKPNRDLNIPNKYTYIKQIYQALEDVNNTTNDDLGHTRYAVILDIKKIKNLDMTDSNPFWKRREVSRKIIHEIYERLNPTLV